ncbi:MAG TPA: hypothetical protein VGH63_13975 [Polyangia bacterium]
MVDAEDDQVRRHRRVGDGERAPRSIVGVIGIAGLERDHEHERVRFLAREQVTEQDFEDFERAGQHE